MSTAAEMSPRAGFVLMVISDGCKDLSSCAATPQRPGLFRHAPVEIPFDERSRSASGDRMMFMHDYPMTVDLA